MRVRYLLVGGGIASLVFFLAISRADDGLEGGSVFMLLLFGLLSIGILVLKTNAVSEGETSTAGVLKPKAENFTTETPEVDEKLPDPLDSGFEIPL
ncbi:MAG: hypothetical protein QGF72_04585 [Candidatus Poseidoniaceae archaeon]|nr:hypothetical protein [Candidatus Poseidoniaceae archaeon]|tara:strand:- start:222 stop:509 length:288 start_codon:yes stop_codon:yes gene_type:complete